MMLVIYTQIHENYGAHAWDGTGECPQYWKAKGGSEHKVRGFIGNTKSSLADSATEAVMMLRSRIERDNDHFRETILDWSLENDDYLSWFEKSQLDYEGTITHKEPIIEYGELA